MTPLDLVRAKTLLYQVEENYPEYMNINRQNLFHFSRFVGKNINLSDVREALKNGWYATFGELVNDVKMVFIQDLLFESLFSKHYSVYTALDFIQSKIGVKHHIDVHSARSILYKFMDAANPRLLNYIKYDPRLFGFDAGICLSTCIIQIELDVYKSMDNLYSDLVKIGEQYCRITPKSAQTLELKELTLLLQINFNKVKLAEQKEQDDYLMQRVQWCKKYMITTIDCIMYNVRYYREVFIPELELDVSEYFNIWYDGVKTGMLFLRNDIPKWMIEFKNTFKTKVAARAHFCQAWRREVSRDNFLFAIWLFSRQAIEHTPWLREQFYSEQDTHRFYINMPFRWSGVAYSDDIPVDEFNERLIAHYEKLITFSVWSRSNPNRTLADFDAFVQEKLHRELVRLDAVMASWSQRHGFTTHRGKGIMIPYNMAHNLVKE